MLLDLENRFNAKHSLDLYRPAQPAIVDFQGANDIFTWQY